MPNLEEMTLVELKALAKENNIKNISKIKKEELIQILKEIEKEEKPSITITEEKSVNQTQYD